MRPRGSSSTPTLLILLALGLLPGTRTTLAAQVTTAEEAETTTKGPTEVEIADWLARVESSTLEEDSKTALLDSYSATLGFVQSHGRSVERTTQLDSLREGAPRRLAEEVDPALQQPSAALPEPDPEATLAQWEVSATQARSDRDTAEKRVADLDEEKRKRNEDRTANPATTQTITARIGEIERDLAAAPSGTDPLDPAFARRQRLVTERRLQKQRLVELKAELTSFDARADLLNKRMELAAKQRKEALALDDHWSVLLSERIREEAEEEADRATLSQTIADQLGLPALQEVARKNLELANLRVGDDNVRDKIANGVAQATELDTRKTELQHRFDQDRKRVDSGLSDTLGQYLHASRRLVFGSSTVEEHLEEIRLREQQMKEVLLQQIHLDEQEQSLGEIGLKVEAAVQETAATWDPVHRQVILETLTSAYRDLRSNLVKAQDDYGAYLVQLNDLDARQKALVALGEQYREYLTEKVLWIRSSPAIGKTTLDHAGAAVRTIVDPKRIKDFAGAYRADIKNRAPYYLLLALTLVCLRSARRKLISRRATLPDRATSRHVHSPLLPVLLSSSEAVVRALPLPTILWFLAWRAREATIGWAVHDYAITISHGIDAVAAFLFSLGVLRQLLRINGLAERTFGWPADSLRSARICLRGIIGIGTPILFIFGCFGPEHAYGDSLGRLAFLALLGIDVLFAWRLRKPFKNVLNSMRDVGNSNAWTMLFMATGVWMPLVLAGLAAWGYYWTASQLADSLIYSGWLFLLLVFAFTIFDQWFQYHRRLIAMERLRRRREEASEEPTTTNARDEARNEALAAIPTEPDEVDLKKANEQTRSMLRNGATILFLLGLWAIWSDVLPALRVLDTVELWTVTSGVIETEITLVNLLLGVSFLVLTAIISANAVGFLDLVVLKRLPLEPGTRYAVVTLVRYGIGATGFALALGAIGVDWGDLQWLVAALMVGLGFGLQEIFGNLVSGLILLLERPVRVGDTVTVNGATGLVTRIRMRATTISDWDRKELVIPNKSFITNDIINWSLTDPIVRVVLPVGVAYGTDVKKVEDILLKAARDNRDVLSDPAPNVVFQTFGDSSLNLDLRVFVPNIDRMVPVRHNMNRAINALFQKNGIEIPFPQRDVHMHIETESDGIVTVRPAPTDQDKDRVS